MPNLKAKHPIAKYQSHLHKTIKAKNNSTFTVNAN